MIEDAKHWLRARAGKVMVISTGVLLALSLLSLTTTLLGGDTSARANIQTQQLIDDLEGDLGTAEAALAAKHETLLAELPGMDLERVGRDRATGRSLLLSLTDSSATNQTVLQTQRRLDARYECLDPTSRTLTEFIPEWMAATGSAHGAGTTYMIGDLDVSLSGVQGLDYSYVGLARLDAVSFESEETTTKSEFVVFTFGTRPDGTVISLEAHRASGSTRDALLAAEERQPKPETTTEPSGGG